MVKVNILTPDSRQYWLKVAPWSEDARNVTVNLHPQKTEKFRSGLHGLMPIVGEQLLTFQKNVVHCGALSREAQLLL